MILDVRKAGNAGSFYPANPRDIQKFIEIFNKAASESNRLKEALKLEPKAIISPHAGYIYSGFSANIAHRVLANKRVKRVVVIGPSHHVYFKGLSGSFFKEYETPFGNIEIDLDYLAIINKNFGLTFAKDAHYKEHSTETQMPFINIISQMLK